MISFPANDTLFQSKILLISIPYPRVNCSKTTPFTAAHTHIADIAYVREYLPSRVYSNRNLYDNTTSWIIHHPIPGFLPISVSDTSNFEHSLTCVAYCFLETIATVQLTFAQQCGFVCPLVLANFYRGFLVSLIKPQTKVICFNRN